MQDPDQLTKSKTIYDVSKWEIFWRSFIAGAGRALGGIILQAIFLIVVVNLFMNQVWPVLEPIMDSLQTTSNAFQDLQNSGSGFEFWSTEQ